MTLKDFVEFAEIYEYTQDRYLIEKMFMELDLIKLHLESYNFLLESNDISLSQIDVLMVESGINDKSFYTEQLFIEKASGIFGAIQKMFGMIGKAIASLFRGTSRAFTTENKEVAELEARNARQQEFIQSIDDLGRAAGTHNKVGEMIQNVEGIADDFRGQLGRAAENINNNIGGGGAKVIPIAGIDHSSAIRLVVDFANKQAGSVLDENQLNIYDTICHKEYEVEGLAMLANIENIIDEISEIIDLSDENTSSIAYNSAKKMQLLGNTYIDKANKICDNIETSTKKNAKFLLSEELINKKKEAADKLNRIFTDLAKYTDVGEMAYDNPVVNVVNRVFKDTGEQARRLSDARNNASMRAKSDNDMKTNFLVKDTAGARKLVHHAIRKQDFLLKFPAYLNVLNRLAIKMQSASAEMTKALTAHMNFRNSIIQTHAELTNSVDKVVSSADQSA